MSYSSHDFRMRLWWAMRGDSWSDWLLTKGISEAIIDRLDAATRWLQRPLCALLGHRPIPDHCGKPEHDYCVCCNRSTPGAAGRIHDRSAA